MRSSFAVSLKKRRASSAPWSPGHVLVLIPRVSSAALIRHVPATHPGRVVHRLYGSATGPYTRPATRLFRRRGFAGNA